MKKIMLLGFLIMGACSPKKELVDIYKGMDGVSCSVSPEYALQDEMSFTQVGVRITCGESSSVLYNGQKGDTGAVGQVGAQGIPGLDGKDGESCSAYRVGFLGTTFLSCPGQWPVAILDGKDGENGASCSSVRQDSQKRVKITCSKDNQTISTSYVYDGEKGNTGATGSAGTSCTVTPVTGGAKVQCGSSSVTLANGSNGAQGLPGTAGATGASGLNGKDGKDGLDGEDAVQPGLSCNVHNLANWDGVTNILTVLSASSPVGSFTLSNLSVGDSPSVNGFPGMPAALQNSVGLEGYALDCNGYLNIKTSGLYNFSLLSDDGVRLIIDGQNIVNDPGLHAPTTDTKSNVELQRGQRPFNVIYYQGPHSQIALQLKYSGPNASSLVVVPSSEFTH